MMLTDFDPVDVYGVIFMIGAAFCLGIVLAVIYTMWRDR